MIEKIKRMLGAFQKSSKYEAGERHCPLCDKSSKTFSEYGVVPRKDARCPHCGSLERHRLVWLYLSRKSKLLTKPPRRALHIAPEGILERKFRPLIGKGYITADLLVSNVDVKMDITDIQYPDESFGFIYCSHVLEHVPDDRKAMREFHRVLTRHGIAILLVPITAKETVEDPSVEDPKERLRLFGQEDHVRRYGPDYLSRLEEEGFVVKKIKRNDFLTPREIGEMGITAAAGELYICKKGPKS
ncbi:class I SAM-dependent methyltransferase [Luteolibacter yonseiensis]|nr:class I SAM-dependent methyltransferase [Luteolibacter yonseiensis]